VRMKEIVLDIDENERRAVLYLPFVTTCRAHVAYFRFGVEN
jgi:hypothetical protein